VYREETARKEDGDLVQVGVILGLDALREEVQEPQTQAGQCAE
jgi:hypothetical protein